MSAGLRSRERVLGRTLRTRRFVFRTAGTLAGPTRTKPRRPLSRRVMARRATAREPTEQGRCWLPCDFSFSRTDILRNRYSLPIPGAAFNYPGLPGVPPCPAAGLEHKMEYSGDVKRGSERRRASPPAKWISQSATPQSPTPLFLPWTKPNSISGTCGGPWSWRCWGRGSSSPTRWSAASIVRGAEIIGEGWHRRFGEAHAEIEALKMAGPRAAGATLYVTLEPCCH